MIDRFSGAERSDPKPELAKSCTTTVPLILPFSNDNQAPGASSDPCRATEEIW
jgi:hypothetical protein